MSTGSRRSDEAARVALLRARFDRGIRPGSGVRVGIGDDAAVVDDGEGRSLVWTVDAQVDGTHFRPEWVSWEDVGWRSFMAAASDIAAMGADPAFALSALSLAPSVDDAALDAIAKGQAAAAEEVGAPVIGGNLARGTETSITTTLLGRTTSPVLRIGARAGDGLWLAGPVGLAAAGLAALTGRTTERAEDPRIQAALAAWRRPRARIADGRAMRGVAHAAIDVSDGLARDATHVAEASGVQIVFDADALAAHAGAELATAAQAVGRDVLDLALHGGEDYALLAASPAPIPGFTRVGFVQEYGGAERVFLSRGGTTAPIEPGGFDHFA